MARNAHSLLKTWGIGATSIDRPNRKIIGFSVASKGDAAGHGEHVDDTTLQQIMALGNSQSASLGSIRARMDHPADGDAGKIENDLDKLLGFPTNFRIDGDCVRADLQLLGATASPDSDRFLALAEEAPHLFGASMVFDYIDPQEHMLKVKKKQNPPVRIRQIYAVDFVDLPATNPQGFFSAGTTTKKEPKMAAPIKAFVRNGKLCMNAAAGMDPGEYEIEMPDEWKKSASDDGDGGDGEEGAKGKHGARASVKGIDPKEHAAALQKAKDEAVAAERAYAAEFETALTSAGLTKPEDVTEFRGFYGRPIADVKFLASKSIGARAKGVGEGSGGDAETEDQKAKKKADAEEAAFVGGCKKRWAADSNLRGMFGVRTNNARDPLYESKLGRFIEVERKHLADQKSKGSAMDQEPTEGDPISRVMRNNVVKV